LLSSHAAADGLRRLPGLGNAQMRHNLLLAGMAPGQSVYWSVQAVDTAFVGGPFAPEGTFTMPPQLNIARAGSDVTISWTPPLPGWSLQESLSLAPAVWSNSPSGAVNPITMPATNSVQFFRLLAPGTQF
jgi:hypothetical protein